MVVLGVLLALLPTLCAFPHVKTSIHNNSQWIDPCTPKDQYTKDIPNGNHSIYTGTNTTYRLIFSDEFNVSNRIFESGYDSKWTAIDHRDVTNMGQHYFLPQAVQVDKGNLVITSSKPKKRYKGARYVSGSVQTWNKFCFTGGFVEVRAILPGKWGIPGTWPAIWLMGNLGRATYLGSQAGTWPWSFDACSWWVENGEKIHQKINACGNKTDKHVKNSYPENYGLNPFQGRGSTEIDIMEAQIKLRDTPAFISTSLQIRPALFPNRRPASETLPGPGQWYEDLKFGNFTRINSDYYGEMGLDSISAVTQLESNSFNSFHLYQLDWMPGPHGYLRWWLDNVFVFEIPGEALNQWVDGIPPRQIPVEPSYIILSTAVSEKFSPPCEGQICDSIWPSNFTIDYVRVYQGPVNEYTSIGCDPELFPSQEWIHLHPVEYGLPWYASLNVVYGLTSLFAAITLLMSLFVMIWGSKFSSWVTFYSATLFLAVSCHAIFSVEELEQFAWIHTTLACLCGVVFGALAAIIPVGALGAMSGFYVGILSGPFVNVTIVRIICGIFFFVGFLIEFVPLIADLSLIVTTSFLGALNLIASASYWFGDDKYWRYLLQMTGHILGGVGYSTVDMHTKDCYILYSALMISFTGAVVFHCITSRQLRRLGYNEPGKSNDLNAKKDGSIHSISASSAARSWRPDDTSVERANFFAPSELPAHMQPYSTVFNHAVSVQKHFGFQTDNLRNQTEHLVMLLTNCSRNGQNSYRVVHDRMFSNYKKWCHKLKIPCNNWTIDTTSPSEWTALDEMNIDLCLYLFIWGEASNLRHCPEYLCFLYHKMKAEYCSNRSSRRDPGHFLDTVITPVYLLLKTQLGSNYDHQYRQNYDDFNEFFWQKECLNYDYKYEKVNEVFSPNSALLFGGSNSFGHDKTSGRPSGPYDGPHQMGIAHAPSFRGGNLSVAEAIAAHPKTFLEKRTWLASLRAFYRIFAFKVVTFHFLAALAFGVEMEHPIHTIVRLCSSALIMRFFLSIIKSGMDVVAIYNPVTGVRPLLRDVVWTVYYLIITVVTLALYWNAWSKDGTSWTLYYVVATTFHLPGIMNAILQVIPNANNWIRRTQCKPVASIRDFLNPMNRLYVGDNVLDPAHLSIGYQMYWLTLVIWKLIFSYQFEIRPLVVPSYLLYRDQIEYDVSAVTTAFLIAIQWFPFFLVYCVDLTIWSSLWAACTGTFVGFASHIGEIRSFHRLRAAFGRAADAFNSKLIASKSKTGQKITESMSNVYGSVGNEVLDQISDTASSSSQYYKTSSASDETPLLSFSRRKQTADEVKLRRRQKWFSFSVAWDSIIESMRADDLICNQEKTLLRFQRVEGYQREIYLPQFQLAGCFEVFNSKLSDIFASDNNVTERALQDKMLQILCQHPMIEEALEEIWELTHWVLVNVLGPCHSNDVRHITSTLSLWAQRGLFRAMDLRKVDDCGHALTDLLLLIMGNLGSWKSNAKYIPVRKSPAEYSSYQFPAASLGLTTRVSVGMTKSASTTGLSSLGGTVPRRSRGSGVARIAAMQHLAKSKDAKSKGDHVIPSAHIMQVRDKLRLFLNVFKNMLTHLPETDPLFIESRGISDRLTWILTQERGFMWDDDYTGEQITLLTFERHSSTILQHLHALLTLQKIDAEPRSYDARRRLLFFVNSLFMDMPLAPLLAEAKSWSVITPFYGEDVLYSRKDLESKRDGLDVHTLLFLQTLYKRDWENFLERVKPQKNWWKDPQTAMELRLWASLRGQTLCRTVQGLMYGEAAIRLLAEIEQVPVQHIEDLVKTKFTYVVACQIYGRQKRNNDPKARDIEFLLQRFPNLRVAYIDEIRVNYQREQSYFAVLIKGGHELGCVEEVYRVRLPGNPILGEGKPENQNSAVIFTRGENLQTIDMNQDGYIEEALKMRNMLQEFDSGLPERPYTIVGLPEHIFTGSVSSLANYMALQETSFVTLGQRTLAQPLRMRLHYGHPDVFDKLFFMSRGGISKASKGVNLSEDIFAGYNNCLRGGSVKFPEYIKCGKGRDVGMQQIYKFEAKLAQGAAEQSLSRDVYRISQRLDFFKLLTFYYNNVGFYISVSLVIWTVFIMLYCTLIRALLSLEGTGGRSTVILSNLQVSLGAVAFFTTAPLVATISVERGFKAAAQEIFMMFITGGPLYFVFHIGTKWFYFGQTILAGGAKYRATGRGFVTKHSHFDELYRFYASSHLYAGVEIMFGLILYYLHTESSQYIAMTWSLWLVVLSWVRRISIVSSVVVPLIFIL